MRFVSIRFAVEERKMNLRYLRSGLPVGVVVGDGKAFGTWKIGKQNGICTRSAHTDGFEEETNTHSLVIAICEAVLHQLRLIHHFLISHCYAHRLYHNVSMKMMLLIARLRRVSILSGHLECFPKWEE